MRAATPVFCAAEYCTVPASLPDAPEVTVSQDESLLADHAKVGCGVDQDPETGAHQDLVIGHDDRDRHAGAPIGSRALTR